MYEVCLVACQMDIFKGKTHLAIHLEEYFIWFIKRERMTLFQNLVSHLLRQFVRLHRHTRKKALSLEQIQHCKYILQIKQLQDLYNKTVKLKALQFN